MKAFVLTVAAMLAALPAFASESWDAVREELFAERPLLDGAEVIAISAPYRSPNDARTDIGAEITAPNGLAIGRVFLVLDENPMPVSAVFEMSQPMPRFIFDVTMRVNGPTPVHVVVETTDSRLWVAETFVKTSGLGACSAPPGTDPAEALASLGRMQIEMVERAAAGEALTLADLSARLSRMDVDISHPSHSGMQMDQISLLFIPMRYVETVDVDLDGAGYVSVTGSISLSENPRIGLSVPSGVRSADVTMTDTDGTVTTEHKKFGGF